MRYFLKDLIEPQFLYTVLAVLVAGGAAIFIGSHIGTVGVSYQDVIIAVVATGGVVILIHKRGVEIGFVMWILMFILGYRIIHQSVPVILDKLLNGGTSSRMVIYSGITPELAIHPLEVVMLGLFSLLVVRQAANSNQRIIVWAIPSFLLAFSVFWIGGWIVGAFLGHRWYNMYDEIKVFIMMYPIFIVTASILQKQALWRTAIATFFAVGVMISLVGFLEYLFPDTLRNVPGLIAAQEDTVVVAQDGFIRAGFVFWGSPTAVFISVMALPFLFPLWNWYTTRGIRIALALGGVIIGIAIYIAGWRSMWFLTLLVFIAMLAARRSWGRLLMAVVIVFVAYQFLPTGTQQRVETILSAFEGRIEDTSTQKRLNRVDDAIQLAITNPLGVGWTGAGWVHNDFVQITANLGLAGGALFIAWYGTTLLALWRRIQHLRDPLMLALLGSFLFGGGMLLTQPMIILPQTGSPLWFIWAIVTVALRQTSTVEERRQWHELSSPY